VRQLAGYFMEERIAVGSAGSSNTVGGDIESLDILVKRIGVLQNAGVLTKKLEMLAGFLKEELDHFGAGTVHGSSPTAQAWLD
jgi:hypothetical protein